MPDHWTVILPAAAMGLSACLVLLLAAFTKNARILSIVSLLLTVLVGGGAVVHLWMNGGVEVPNSADHPFGMITADPLALFFGALTVLVTALVILLGPSYFERKSLHRPEFYGLLMISATGMIVLASATHLVTFYLGLETMSIAFYVLAGSLRTVENALEASLKYFLLGAFSSAFLLFGMALLYGSCGYLDYVGLASSLGQGVYHFGEPMALTGFFLFLVGIFFKLSLIPFHFWAPDVYQGAPTPVTAFMAVGGKAAAMVGAIRIFFMVFSQSPVLSDKWFAAFAGVGLVTVFVGAMIALTQRHIKRLLAYSSIVHAGFIALGLSALAVSKDLATAMMPALLFYITAYLFMNVGAFTVAASMEQTDATDERLRTFSGLGVSSPLLASLFSLIMFSLAGIPLTVGFLGKFYVFKALVEGKVYWLAVAGFVAAVIATYYYLKVVVTLWFPPAGEEIAEAPHLCPATWAVLVLVSFPVLVLGVFPNLVNVLIATVNLPG